MPFQVVLYLEVDSFCSCVVSILELYDITFILFCSFNLRRTAPNPIRDASTEI